MARGSFATLIAESSSDLANLFGITYNTIVRATRVVLDTNVLVSAMRSRRGASFRVIDEIGRGRFEIVVSVPLVVERAVSTRLRQPVVSIYCSNSTGSTSTIE